MRLRSYAQLLRVPNVFTALADIALGTVVGWYVFSSSTEFPWLIFASLLLCSACLYCAGMVFNDVFDVDQDRHERPFRPLPSGRITVKAAWVLGTALLLAGLACAWLAGYRSTSFIWLPFIVAGLLTLAILLYNAWLKRTWAGPLGMGTCRFLNVLLGLAVIGSPTWRFDLYLALIVGLYIVGVTWFARTEARTSSQTALTGAAAIMFASLVLAVLMPGLPDDVLPPTHITAALFPYLLIAFGCVVGYPIVEAIREPGPKTVQRAVKRSILGLVVLDAVLATGLVGLYGLLILLLLPPAMFLGRWIYST